MNTKDFNSIRQVFSNEEIEQLCSLYMEGNLDMEEEKALAKVLASSAYSGEIVEETLFLMGLSVSESYLIKEDAKIRRKDDTVKLNMKRSLFNILKTCAAAACIVFSVSMIWNYFGSSKIDVAPVYEVYADGKKISDPEQCRLMALRSYEKSQRFIAEMKAIQNERLKDLENKKMDADRKYKEMQSCLNEIN